jgi:hypothetical protein
MAAQKRGMVPKQDKKKNHNSVNIKPYRFMSMIHCLPHHRLRYMDASDHGLKLLTL